MASDYQKRLEYEALSKKNAEDLNEAERERLELLDAHFERLDRINSKSEDLAGSLAKQLKYTGQQAEAFKKVVNSFQPLNEKASELYDVVTSLKDPLSAGFKLIELSAKRFIELDNAGKAFRETTGFLASQTKEVEKIGRAHV